VDISDIGFAHLPEVGRIDIRTESGNQFRDALEIIRIVSGEPWGGIGTTLLKIVCLTLDGEAIMVIRFSVDPADFVFLKFSEGQIFDEFFFLRFQKFPVGLRTKIPLRNGS
jgi:hypothetical protein